MSRRRSQFTRPVGNPDFLPIRAGNSMPRPRAARCVPEAECERHIVRPGRGIIAVCYFMAGRTLEATPVQQNYSRLLVLPTKFEVCDRS
jgi:predicted N-formylglutamate amidohydrolase